ncbi:MAG: Eco57I restriction-modification methylase domain-containing protein, partial [Candidatus Hodarchaeota archaeon]
FDIISNLYGKTRDYKEKKKLGEFYTPISIVNYILDAMGYKSTNKIEVKKLIDISCGSGSFIIQAIRRLVRRHLEIYNRKEISDLTAKEAKDIICRVKNNIFGLDINKIACILCQININYVLFDLLKVIRNSDPNYYLPIFEVKNINTLTITTIEDYDLVVGNPPYLFIRDIPKEQRKIIENGKFETNDGQYDYYQIFMELGIKILKNQGLLGFIVPDSLLALSNRSIIRKYIYNKTKIKEVYHTGPKFNDSIVSNIIIILEKENNALERKKNQIKLKISKEQENFIPQTILRKWDFKFLIHLNRTDISILDHLNRDFHKLKDLKKKYDIKIALSRGVELTKTGEIIYCEICNKYSPIPKNQLKCQVCNSPLNKKNIEKIIYTKIPDKTLEPNYKLYLYSIKRYQITQYKYIDISKTGINYKDLSNYENRIIIRQISQNKKICATYDKNLSLTSQSFYNLKIEKSNIPEFNNYYLLGILNSDLLSYYFIKSFGSYKQLFPRILIEKINDFPIKIPISDNEERKAKKIIKNVKRILIEYSELNYLQKQIDSLVFELYGISDRDQEYILNYMKSLN